VVLAGNKEQKKKYLGRMVEEPLICVSIEMDTCIFKIISAMVFVLLVFDNRLMVSLNLGQDLMSPVSKQRPKRRAIITF
jgi:hypothetical protein